MVLVNRWLWKKRNLRIFLIIIFGKIYLAKKFWILNILPSYIWLFPILSYTYNIYLNENQLSIRWISAGWFKSSSISLILRILDRYPPDIQRMDSGWITGFASCISVALPAEKNNILPNMYLIYETGVSRPNSNE